MHFDADEDGEPQFKPAGGAPPSSAEPRPSSSGGDSALQAGHQQAGEANDLVGVAAATTVDQEA